MSIKVKFDPEGMEPTVDKVVELDPDPEMDALFEELTGIKAPKQIRVRSYCEDGLFGEENKDS